ncbi:MAG: UDP-3-O-(3-hydroxymyristoyl)glucosamine N-acyltransferase [Betaproteobacteria bacterium]|jgi:UDP-3-O-[3-hydroxymyristoyl] glucosamine N-acyltransferase|nr:UDP-3-O-(3-hydroxymyristoyl)glucosamine N-acyltransferase [Betaproteobacteria bacterium]
MPRIDVLVAQLGGELVGNGGVEVHRVAPLERAGEGDLAFLASPKYLSRLKTSRAVAFIVKPEHRDIVDDGRSLIVTDDPYLYFARASQFFNPLPPIVPGVHSLASVRCAIPATVAVDAGAVVEEGAEIGEDVLIGANCYIGREVRIGRGTRLAPNVTIYANCVIGENCIIHAGAVIGSDGFGFARESSGKWVKIPQIGRVVIGNDVEIGSNTSVDRGALEDTVIGDGVKLDNQIQIGHNTRIGEHTAVAGSTGIAGSAIIGARCMIGGQAGISGHISIADDAVVFAATTITRSVRTPGVYVNCLPQLTHAEWARNFAHIRHLDTLVKKVRLLEQRLEQQEKAG